MARMNIFGFTLAAALLAASTVSSQVRLETVQYKTGKRVTGEILQVKENRIVLARKVGSGSVREEIRFERIEPVSLYTCLVSALKPLDKPAHRRIAEAAYAARLFPTAKRHYLKSAADAAAPSPEIADLVAQCEEKDIEKLMMRSTDELLKENFKMSRRIALMVMRRYPAHPKAQTVPDHLERIKRRHAAARRREAAVAKTRKEKAEWEAAEKQLDQLDGRVRKAASYEVRSLRSTSKLRTSKGYIDLGLRELHRADRALLKLRQSEAIPSGLKPRLVAIDDEVLAMQIRLRLHLSSLYSVRGSYGTALSWANEALAFDPTDKSALDARSRIEQAAAAAAARINRRIIR